MSMINNYLDTLASYLPEEMRDEVREELEADILEQREEKSASLGRELTGDEESDLLKKIGHPMRVAARYLPDQQLIGPDYFPAYKKALEIALMIVLGINLLFRIPGIIESGHVIGSFIQTSIQLFNVALTVFASVTLVFYLMEKYGANLDEIYAWSPSELTAKSGRLAISRVESFFEASVSIIFLGWWNNAFALPDSLINDYAAFVIDLSPEWQAVHLSVNIVVGLGILVNLVNYIGAGWNRFSLSLNMALDLATIAIAYQITRFENFVVLNTPETVQRHVDISIEILNQSIYWFMVGIIIFSAYDLYKSFRRFLGNA